MIYLFKCFTQDDGNCPSFSRRVSCDVSLENIEFTPGRVLKAIKLKHTKNESSLDSNGFSSALFKKLGNPLIKPLRVLFSFAFNSGEILDDWRLDNIMPIFKKGSSAACSIVTVRFRLHHAFVSYLKGL